MYNKPTKELVKYTVSASPEERVYLCEKSFALFVIYYFIDYLKYPFASFHYEWFDAYEKLTKGGIKELALIGFRESAKTSLSKIYLIYLICYNKKNYINVDSFDKENAERMLFDVAFELQQNPRLIADFGQLFNESRSKDRVASKKINNFVTNNKVRVEAHSTQESIRGRLHGSQRPDFLLFDDIETNKTKESAAYTKQVADHLSEAIAGADSGEYSIIYLGNYITEYGNIASLKKRAKDNPDFYYSEVPIIDKFGITWRSKYVMTDKEAKETGKVSIEERKRLLGSQVFNAEMMNNPIDEESQEFFEKNFQSITKEEVEKLNTRQFVAIDTALSKRETQDADSTGITKCWTDIKNNWYLEAEEYQINSKSLVDLIFIFHGEGFEKIGVEETAYFEAIKPFFEEECAKRGVYPRVIPLKHGGVKKETRIRGLIPKYEAKHIYHIEGKCKVLEEQLVRFPNAQHDDVADATAYLLKLAEPVSPQSSLSIPEEEVLYEDIGV